MVPEPETRPGGRRRITWFVVPLAGSAVLGTPAGLLWGEVAPRALLREIGKGTAELVNAETTAFIGADAWFCGIAAVAGLIAGVLGYRFGVAGRDQAVRAASTAGLILGAVAGAFVMLWLGERVGLSGYQHALESSQNGTAFHASLGLGAKSALAFWPMLTSIVILVAEWRVRRRASAAHPTDPMSIGYGAPPD
jgi:hypothetical protein